MDCIFCKIVKGEIPCARIYEDGEVLVFLDINPLSKGHSLVIPKGHFETISDIPEKELFSLAKALKKTSVAIQKATGAHGINITQNNGRAADQLVPHAHFHVIPRFEGDGIRSPHGKQKYAQGEMEETRKKISELI
jgi:histidine triad (HIT) family protein